MIIYIDVLLTVNFLVDFFIVRASLYFAKISSSIKRSILCSLVATAFSLYIFLPEINLFLEIILRIFPAVFVSLIVCGFKNIKRILRLSFWFYIVSFIYAGLMMGIWMLFSPERLSINNGVVYFNISPLLIITLSLVFYLFIVAFTGLTKRNSESAILVESLIIFDDKRESGQALVDSGHSLNDMFSSSAVIILSKSLAKRLFGDADTEDILSLKTPDNVKLATKLRLLTVQTVAGEKIMPAIKVDFLKINIDKRNVSVEKPLAVISDTELGDEYSMIIPPDLIF